MRRPLLATPVGAALSVATALAPAGTDVNGNGVIGERRLGRLGALFGARLSDPGDSILAAEVAAARHLLRGLDEVLETDE